MLTMDPAPERDHHARHHLAAPEHGVQVDGQDPVPILADVLARTNGDDAGVVDQDVHPAEPGDQVVDHGLELVDVGDIDPVERRPVPCLGQLGHGLAPGLAVDLGNGNVRSGFAELLARTRGPCPGRRRSRRPPGLSVASPRDLPSLPSSASGDRIRGPPHRSTSSRRRTRRPRRMRPRCSRGERTPGCCGRWRTRTHRRGEVVDAAPHLLPHFCGRSERENPLRVHAASPEDDVAPVGLLQEPGVHAARGHLDGVEDVRPDLDEIRDEFEGSPAPVIQDLGVGLPVDDIEDPPLLGLHEASVEVGVDQPSVLPRDVVHEQVRLDVGPTSSRNRSQQSA